ncbi:hypothetical protein ACRALDRAFT_1066936 [Sodiomyces alcalophilus JCM 7366]|uniref:uncharacterized protein n=1 Tax=Sodiomyces alcalophilus JCM 7366 TaxID=591952 RepID=UPI0039B480D7
MGKSRDKKAPVGGTKKPTKAPAKEPEYRVSLTNTILGMNPLIPAKTSLQGNQEKTDVMHGKKGKNGCKQLTVAAVDENTSGESSAESNGTESSFVEANAAADGTDGDLKITEQLTQPVVLSETSSKGESFAASSPDAPKPKDEETQVDDEGVEASSISDGSTCTISEASSSTPLIVDDWTMSQDAMILGMKEDNATWAEIGSAIGRGKNEVKKRYHELKVKQANEVAGIGKRNIDLVVSAPVDKGKRRKMAGLVAPPPSENTTESESEPRDGSGTEEGGVASISSGDLPGKLSKHVNFTDSEEESEFGESEEEEYEEDDDDEEEDEEEEEDESEDEERDDFYTSLSYTSSSSDDEDGYDADDYDPYGPMDPIAWERERRRQQRFVERHLWASLYNNAGANHPAEQGFSKRDRAILASLHDRAVANRYLEMQANFFNATGRMVPLHLIQAKLEGRTPTEEEHMLPRVARFQARVAKWNHGVASREELLDPSVASDVPVDALRGDE